MAERVKFVLELHKTYTIDSDLEWRKDLSFLIEKLIENGVEPGSTASSDEIHDAIREMLSDAIDSVVDLDIEADDFIIHVEDSQTLNIPKEEGDPEAA